MAGPYHTVWYGTARAGVFGPRDHGRAIAVLRRAVELGVDHIDTSQYYGTSSPAHLEENLAVAGIDLGEAISGELNAI